MSRFDRPLPRRWRVTLADCLRTRTAIKDGIVQIVRTFGEKLAAFRFPPRIAKKLQGFVDYN